MQGATGGARGEREAEKERVRSSKCSKGGSGECSLRSRTLAVTATARLVLGTEVTREDWNDSFMFLVL
jgi:hypothetical protein